MSRLRFSKSDRPQLGWVVFCLAIVLLGVGFRLFNLDGKVYWHDEAYTSLRVSGYTLAEVEQQLFDGRVIDVTALDQYQQPNPDRGAIDTIKTLAIDDAQHPPLYYVLVRAWVLTFANSIAATRSFSVLVGLLVLPSIYLLCQALFASTQTASAQVGWMAAALIAVSPFHLLYAQEAREYALWTLLIVLSSWALLRALRVKTVLSWGIYSLTLLLGLYTYLFMALVAIGHGAYVLAIDRRQSVVPYLLSLLVALLAFAPWFWLVITTWSTTGATWTSVPIPLPILLKLWALSLERAFVLTIGDFGFDTSLVYVTLPLLLILVGYALYQLCRETPARIWWFVLTLIGSTALPLALPDLILGGQRSTSSRYLVPCYLGVQLAVAYLLASRLSDRRRQIGQSSWQKVWRKVWGIAESIHELPAEPFVSRWGIPKDPIAIQQRQFWQRIAAIVLLVGVISCFQTARADTAWNKVVSIDNRAIAHIVNTSTQPLLVTSSFGINFGNILALSHLLDPQVKLQLVRGAISPDFANVPQIPAGHGSVFLLNLSDRLRQAIEHQQHTTAKLVFNDTHLFLWQLR